MKLCKVWNKMTIILCFLPGSHGHFLPQDLLGFSDILFSLSFFLFLFFFFKVCLLVSGAFLCNVFPFWCHKTKESHLICIVISKVNDIKLSFPKVLKYSPRQYLTEIFPEIQKQKMYWYVFYK